MDLVKGEETLPLLCYHLEREKKKEDESLLQNGTYKKKREDPEFHESIVLPPTDVELEAYITIIINTFVIKLRYGPTLIKIAI